MSEQINLVDAVKLWAEIYNGKFIDTKKIVAAAEALTNDADTLRARIAELEAERDHFADERNMLRAENTRLREALEEAHAELGLGSQTDVQTRLHARIRELEYRLAERTAQVIPKAPECDRCGSSMGKFSLCGECCEDKRIASENRITELEGERDSAIAGERIAKGELAHDREVFNRILSHAERTARRDGAEAALRWAAEEMWWREVEQQSFIQRGLKAVCGDGE